MHARVCASQDAKRTKTPSHTKKKTKKHFLTSFDVIMKSEHITVKLGYYVHGLVRTLGYNVLSVDHEHRQSENMYIFFG